MKRRVVITGMGAVTPIGNQVSDLWNSVRAGACGIAPITHYDTTDSKVKLAAEVKDLDFSQHIPRGDLRKQDRFTRFAVIAAREAVTQSGIDPTQENMERCGVLLSSGIGGIETIAQEHCRGQERGFDKVSPFFIPMSICNMAAGTVAIQVGAKGMCTSVVTACAASSNAIGDGFRHIRDGYADMMVCGGTEASITQLAMGGFTSMQALSHSTDPARASIPFDAERNGFVMGEGAGILFLEEYSHAKARNATILGEIVGYGATCDAHHMTAPLADGSGAARSMALALSDAGVSSDQVGYLNAHGTSTPLNDKCETLAIHQVFSHPIPVSSTKSMTGHLLGASGAVEAIITLLALKESFLPATIHHQVEDPACDLNLIKNQGISCPIDYALSNSLGFGGHNASLLFKKVVD